jgi:hypothetical protein
MHHQLRNDAQRQRHEESRLDLQVPEKRYGHVPAQCLAFQSRERQQRQPGQQRENESGPPRTSEKSRAPSIAPSSIGDLGEVMCPKGTYRSSITGICAARS